MYRDQTCFLPAFCLLRPLSSPRSLKVRMSAFQAEDAGFKSRRGGHHFLKEDDNSAFVVIKKSNFLALPFLYHSLKEFRNRVSTAREHKVVSSFGALFSYQLCVAGIGSFSPVNVTRCIIRRTLRLSNGSTQCIVQRLSHIMTSSLTQMCR